MKKKIRPFWLTLAVLLGAAILALCFIAVRGGMLWLRTDGDPGEVAAYFFDALFAGEYRSAYSCLSDVSGLGLENEPTTEAGRSVYRALRASYAYTPVGDCRAEGLQAVQHAQLRVLDVGALEAAVAAQIDAVAEELVSRHPAEEIYDDDRNYLASFTDEVYATALDRTLQHASDYYTTAELDLTLRYADGVWRLQTSPALFNALLGNV